MTTNGPVKINQTMNFEIIFEKFGTGTCLWVDLGDNSSLLAFGNNSCPGQIDVDSINPNIVTEPRLKYTYKHPDTQIISFNHVYNQVGSYDVRMRASNLVSSKSYELTAVVLSYVCKNPNVTIKGNQVLLVISNFNHILHISKFYNSCIVLTPHPILMVILSKISSKHEGAD